MKKLFLILFLLSPLAQAETGFKVSPDSEVYNRLPSELKECSDVGFNKVVSQAKSFGVQIDESSFTAEDIHSNLLATYVLWSVRITDSNGRTDLSDKVAVTTQKPALGTCF